MASIENPLRLQAARVLENIQTLDRQYGPLIADRDPHLAEALGNAAVALERFVSGNASPGSRDAAAVE